MFGILQNISGKETFIFLFPSVSPTVLASPNNLQTLKPKFCDSGICVHLN